MIVRAECSTSLIGYSLVARETMRLFSLGKAAEEMLAVVSVSKSSFLPRFRLPCCSRVASSVKRAEIPWRTVEPSIIRLARKMPTCTNMIGSKTSIGLRLSENRSQVAKNHE